MPRECQRKNRSLAGSPRYEEEDVFYMVEELKACVPAMIVTAGEGPLSSDLSFQMLGF